MGNLNAAFIFNFFRAFSVTQNPRYLPSIKRVCDSMAGIEPKAIMQTGKRIHCKIISAYLMSRLEFGLGGKRMVEIIAEAKSPSIPMRIKVSKTFGAFCARTLPETLL